MITIMMILELIEERDRLKRDLLEKRRGESAEQETERIQRQYERLQ
jgi:hypothetical protein